MDTIGGNMELNPKDYTNAPYGAWRKAVERANELERINRKMGDKHKNKILFIDFVPEGQIRLTGLLSDIDECDADKSHPVVVSLNDKPIAKAWRSKSYYVIKGVKNV
jgi:hypothetical protein